MRCKITAKCFIPGLGVQTPGSVVDVPVGYEAAVLHNYGEPVDEEPEPEPKSKSKKNRK